MKEIALILSFLGQREELPHGAERQEDAIVGGVIVAMADALTTPMTSKRIPFSRIVLPTAGRPGNRFFSISSASTATIRRCDSSSSLSQRPAAIGSSGSGCIAEALR